MKIKVKENSLVSVSMSYLFGRHPIFYQYKLIEYEYKVVKDTGYIIIERCFSPFYVSIYLFGPFFILQSFHFFVTFTY